MDLEKSFLVANILQHLDILKKLELLKSNYQLSPHWRVLSLRVDVLDGKSINIYSPGEATYLPDLAIYNDDSLDYITIKFILLCGHLGDRYFDYYDTSLEYTYNCYKFVDVVFFNNFSCSVAKNKLFSFKEDLNIKYGMKISIQDLLPIDNFESLLVNFQKTRNNCDSRIKKNIIENFKDHRVSSEEGCLIKERLLCSNLL